MKRFLTLVLILCITVLSLGLTACGSDGDGYIVAGSDGYYLIRIGVSPVPHAEILDYIRPFLLEDGIRLDLVEFSEFPQVNPALSDGSLDANFFQHMPFLNNYMTNTGNELHVVGTIHIEPMGAYSMTLSDISELSYGAEVVIPDCPVNGPRALMLLETHGILSLNPDVRETATTHEIIDNPLALQFTEIAPALLPRVMLDEQGDLFIINTNHVLNGTDLNPVEDSLIMELPDPNSPYANMLVVQPINAENEAILTLMRHLNSDRVRAFILRTYDGVVPVF